MIIHQIIFLLLVSLSAWLFCSTIFKRFTAVKMKGIMPKVGNIPRGIWRVFKEVILQWRVIRDRPIVGIMHALVMWGFFVFSWITMKHLFVGFINPQDLTHIEHDWYDTFAAFWAAIAVIIAMVVLSARRFVIMPKSLGDKRSLTSGIVAILIVLLMMTHLFSWSNVTNNFVVVYVNWWLHTLALFGMLVVIPKSKHLHLLLAPLAIFFRSETTSKMRALDIENEDFGMIKFSDLLPKDVLDINACVECGRCTEVCPANIGGGTLNPKSIILNMQKGFLAGGNIIAGTDQEVSRHDAWVSENDLFQCLSCGACEQACPVGIEHVGGKILDLRRGLASEGRIDNEKVTKLYSVMEKAPHNPWGIGQDMRRKFVEKEKLPIFDGSQEWLFWLGCGLSYDPHGQKVAVAMREILDAGNISWGVFENETCCGEPARKTGNEGLYLELSQKLIEKFKQNKVKKIISCCPHCTTTLDNDYRQIPEYESLDIEVVHHSELIAKIIPDLNLEFDFGEITYHDPCYLARGRNVVSAPRMILETCGLDIKEMEHFGHDTFCCGAGGGQMFIADDKKIDSSSRINHLRFQEAQNTKVNAIAVACPYCPIMLQDAANHVERTDIKIWDIAEIVSARLKPRQKEAEKEDAVGSRQEEVVVRDGVRFYHHPNGGGLVAETAQVAPSVHVAPLAIVFGEAQLSENFQVTGRAQVGGSVVASDEIVFGGSVIVTEGEYRGKKIVYKK